MLGPRFAIPIPCCVRHDELAIPEQRNEAYELIRREKWIGLQIAEKARELMERQSEGLELPRGLRWRKRWTFAFRAGMQGKRLRSFLTGTVLFNRCA